MDRIALKFKTAVNYLPKPEISDIQKYKLGMIYFGTTSSAIQEVLDNLAKKGISLDTMRLKAFPFHNEVREFIENHELVYVIEQNRDAQLNSLLKIECNAKEEKMCSILNYNGVLITAQQIEDEILDSLVGSEEAKDASA